MTATARARPATGNANRNQKRRSKFPGERVWRHESARDEVMGIPLFGRLRTLASSIFAIARRGSSRCGGRHTANAGRRFGAHLLRLPFTSEPGGSGRSNMGRALHVSCSRTPFANASIQNTTTLQGLPLCAAFDGLAGCVAACRPTAGSPLSRDDACSLGRSKCSSAPGRCQTSTIATARVQPAEARSIFTGKHDTMNPVDGSASRLCSFSIWQ